MKIDVAKGAFSAFIDREVTAKAKRAVTAGVKGATEGLKTELRQAVNNAGLGERLGRAIQSEVYPDDSRGRVASLSTAGLVFVRRGKGKRTGAEEIFDAFNRGVTITRPGGKYLAIPTPAVPKTRGRQMSPAEVEQFYGRPLQVREGNQPGQLLAFLNLTRARSTRRPGDRVLTKGRRAQGRTEREVLLFVLVRSVKLGKRLDFNAIAQSWADQVPRLIAQNS